MFESYTDHARRVIFFARYEASVLGSPAIDTEHLLLGWLRDAPATGSEILKRAGLVSADLRTEIQARIPPGDPISTSVDIPLTAAAKRALQRAADEASRGGSPAVDADHVFLGLLGEPDAVAGQLLRARGLRLDAVREEVRLSLPSCAPVGGPSDLSFQKLLGLLATLERRRVPHHVAVFRGDSLRVEIARPEQRWSVTFFADGHVGVDVFQLTAEGHDESTLAALLQRLEAEGDQ